jgi:hypothetical protein
MAPADPPATNERCLDGITGCAVEGFHDHPASLPPDVVLTAEQGLKTLPAADGGKAQTRKGTPMNRWLLHKDTGRLRGLFNPRYLRHTEIRWMGRRVQWVISPIQVAFWTQMHTAQPNNRFHWSPLSRAWVG